MMAGRSPWLCQGRFRRLDRELAEAELTVLDLRRLLLEVDGSEHRVGYSLAGMGDRCARVGFDFVGRALAGERRRQTGDSRTRYDARQNEASAKSAAVSDELEHVHDLLVALGRKGRGDMEHRSIGGRKEMPNGF